uniref:Acyltransferase n=1 Tax=Myotis lucifugus TaxID=59463 RepID=G1PCI5_MYOLU
ILLPSKKDLKIALEFFAIFHWALSILVIVIHPNSYTLIMIANAHYIKNLNCWPCKYLSLEFLWFSFPESNLSIVQFCVYKWAGLWPEELLKTHGIFPHHSYILVCHPHGFMSHSYFGNFATEASGFTKIFPGITPYVLTLGAFFWVPFLRDYAMLTWACSVSQSSMDYLFTQKGTGNMLVVVVSGLVECRYHTLYRLFLRNWTGFVRKALQHGVALIPAYAFGEVGLYHQHIFTSGGLVNHFQKWFQSVHIYPCDFNERGFTENSWGLLPYAQPGLAVREPLPVPKIEKPSQEMVDKYHGSPAQTDQHKTLLGCSETQELVIV